MQTGSHDHVLKGSRRELTREMCEELAALQCRAEEIEGYTGTDRKKLESWCRRVYGRRSTLDGVLHMLRQDGLIAIRRASFEQLKRSAALIAQQYNRFLPGAGQEENRESAAVKAFAAMLDGADGKKMQALFDEENDEAGG